jgi:methyltransferase (TIGR00027 family)
MDTVPVTDSIPADVGKTALGVAMVRAHESQREDRLFDDRYAQAFLDAAPTAFDVEQRAAAAASVGDMASCGAAFWAHVVIRTRFFDDYLLGATAGGIQQVVLLAAGLDTRAFRLAWPASVRLYELDLPAVLEFKERILTDRDAVPRCRRRSIAVDLREDFTGPLTRAGLSTDEPAAWLVEGLLIYLTAGEAARLLTRVGDLSAAGSMVALEVDALGIDPLRAKAERSPEMAPYTKLWKGGLPDVAGWLTEHGWRPEMHDRATVSSGYGRPDTTGSTGGFLTATRR